MHEVLVNRLGGLSLPRKSVVRLIDCPDMTLDVYRGRLNNNTTVKLVLSKLLSDNQNVLAKDRCLLNKGTFQYICLFRETNICLFNTGYLLNRGGQ